MRRNHKKAQEEKNQFNFGATLDLSEITENSVGSVSIKHRAYRKSYSDQFTENVDKFLGYHKYDGSINYFKALLCEDKLKATLIH